jgi:hypothetical protein
MGGQVVRPAAATVVRTQMTRYDRFWEPAIMIIAAAVLLFVP